MKPRRLLLLCAATLSAASCASLPEETRRQIPTWAANGWLAPGRDSEPEIIGLFVRRSDCEEALAEWLSRQVVGNPIHGECLPIDRR